MNIDFLIQAPDPGYNYSVLAPVLLLVIVELSSIAREIDLKNSVSEDHAPIILNGLLGIVFFPLQLLYPIFNAAFSIDPVGWLQSRGNPLEGTLITRATDILIPKLGRFSLIHTVNNGLLISGIYATAGQFSGPNRFFSLPVLFFVALSILPVFEVSEYDRLLREVSDQGSYFIHVWLNFIFTLNVVTSPESVTPRVFVFWILLTSYLFLVFLAHDIANLSTGEPSSDTKNGENA